MRKIISLISSILILAVTMPFMVAGYSELTRYLGLRPAPVPVVGTGSMYPSLYWTTSEGGPDNDALIPTEEYRTTPHMYHRFPGITLGGKTFLRRQVGFGDMVAFQSATTASILAEEGKDIQAGFIKRVIGLPGDTIELRDGYVIRNGTEIHEPYIYKPRSTYGDNNLSDCVSLTIPPEHYFVLGDNRKNSSDSRGELGLVKDAELSFILPLSEQKIYQTLWRDTSKDSDYKGTPTLNADEFVKLLNVQRTEANLPPLTLNRQLVTSAGIKGKQILSGNPQFTLAESLNRAGYTNITYGEFISRGQYTETELLQNLLFFGNTAGLVLSSEFSDIGVSATTQEVDGCPSQVIVGHLGGYKPASYSKEIIDSWQDLLDNLNSVIPSWEAAREYPQINKAKLEELLTLLNRRRDLASEILDVMRRSAWLTSDQEYRIEADNQDGKRIEELVNELNELQ